VNIGGCVSSCYTTWDFTARKVPVGSEIISCVWNDNTGHTKPADTVSHIRNTDPRQCTLVFLLLPIQIVKPRRVSPVTRGQMKNSIDSQFVPKAPIAETNEVSILTGSSNPEGGQGFVPPSIAIETDTTVTWTNNDDTLHTVTSGNPEAGNSGTEFDSSYLASSKKFQHDFTSKGQYTVHLIHL
jgi:plastocyanin